MNDDFESTVRTLLNERVDAKIGEREVPRFVPTGNLRRIDSVRRRGPWVLPLLAAACVAAVVGGSVGAAHLLADKHHTFHGPATHSPSPKHTPTPSPSDTRTFAPDRPGTVTLGGARIQLPDGWVARDYQRYLTPDEGFGAPQVWCLTPRTTPARTVPGACPMLFETANARGAGLDVDIQGGHASNPEYCVGDPSQRTSFQAAERAFGGRVAEWRHWTISCPRYGRVYRIEQYVVATSPAYILYSGQADAAVHAAMTSIVHSASVPAQDLPLRLEDHGVLRTIVRRADGVHITITRVALALHSSAIHLNPRTAAYVVPTRMFRLGGSSGPLKIGDTVHIDTNGTKVVQIYPES